MLALHTGFRRQVENLVWQKFNSNSAVRVCSKPTKPFVANQDCTVRVWDRRQAQTCARHRLGVPALSLSWEPCSQVLIAVGTCLNRKSLPVCGLGRLLVGAWLWLGKRCCVSFWYTLLLNCILRRECGTPTHIRCGICCFVASGFQMPTHPQVS